MEWIRLLSWGSTQTRSNQITLLDYEEVHSGTIVNLRVQQLQVVYRFVQDKLIIKKVSTTGSTIGIKKQKETLKNH